MKNTITTRVPLLKYVKDRIEIKSGEGRGSITAKVIELLTEIPIIIVENSNSHNYPVGKTFIFPQGFLADKISVDLKKITNNIVAIVGINFSGLNSGGNTVVAQDMIVLEEITKSVYKEGLMLLQQILQYELSSLEEDISDKDKEVIFSQALLELLQKPIGIPSILNINLAISQYKQEINETRRKELTLDRLYNQSIFLQF